MHASSIYIPLIQWNGKESNKDERAKAAEFMLSIKVYNIAVI